MTTENHHDHKPCCGGHSHSARDLMSKAKDFCRLEGHQYTAPRAEILNVLAQSPKALGAYEILNSARIEGKIAKPPTVYRAIEFWLEHGFIHRIESLNAYVSCDHDHGKAGVHFLVCERCKTVREEHTPSPLKAIDLDGFEPKHSQTETVGICKDCH